MTDESGAFTQLSTWCDHRTVVHSREYVADDGTSENQAESFFSRMRRAEYGVYQRGHQRDERSSSTIAFLLMLR